MKISQLCIPNMYSLNIADFTKITNQELMIATGVYRKECSGVFGYAHIGAVIMRNLHNFLAEEFENQGIQEVNFGLLQKVSDWEESGRFETYQKYMILTQKGRMCLAPTHEEAALKLIKDINPKYSSLPLGFFQIGKKFRGHRPSNSPRTAIEFEMADAYMLHAHDDQSNESVNRLKKVVESFFKRFDISVHYKPNGNYIPVWVNSQGINTEVAKIQLEGTELSEKMGITYKDQTSVNKPFNLICAGMGMGRALEMIVSTHRDDKGINWPDEIRPFYLGIIPVNGTAEERETIENLRKKYKEKGKKSIIHDGSYSLGRRIREIDLIGCAEKIIVGKRELESGELFIEQREGTKRRITL